MQNLILTKMIITATFHHSVAALLLTSTLPAKWVQSLVGGSVGSPDNKYQANKNTDIYKYRFVDCTNTIPDIYKYWSDLDNSAIKFWSVLWHHGTSDILRKFSFSLRQKFAEQVWFALRKCIPDRKSKAKSIFAHKGWFSPTATKIIPPVEAIMVARGLPAPNKTPTQDDQNGKDTETEIQIYWEGEKHNSHTHLFGGES